MDTLKSKLRRFKLDRSLHEDPIDVEGFEETCVIFDDTECIADQEIRREILTLLDQRLEVGRHWTMTCLITFHRASDKHTSRNILNQSQYYVFFLNSFAKSVKSENHFDIDDTLSKHFKRSNSRWVLTHKHCP